MNKGIGSAFQFGGDILKIRDFKRKCTFFYGHDVSDLIYLLSLR